MLVRRGFLSFGLLVFSAASLFGQSNSTANTVFSTSASRLVALNAAPVADSASGSVPEPTVAAAPIATPVRPTKTVTEDPNYARNKKIWYSLVAMNHTAAFVDAYSTRRAVQRGAQELNPLMKPFANSNAMYPATQVIPFGMDYLGRRMMKSENPLLRKLWWLPQTASTAASLVAGIHNLSVK